MEKRRRHLPRAHGSGIPQHVHSLRSAVAGRIEHRPLLILLLANWIRDLARKMEEEGIFVGMSHRLGERKC